MKSFILIIVFSAAYLVLTSCVTPPPLGSRDEAVNMAWERYCNSGYCEGGSYGVAGCQWDTFPCVNDRQYRAI